MSLFIWFAVEPPRFGSIRGVENKPTIVVGVLVHYGLCARQALMVKLANTWDLSSHGIFLASSSLAEGILF